MAATTDEQNHAAQVIQRNYRGYRERRQLQGMGLDASARWAEARAAEEAELREKLTTPEQRARASSTAAREKWKKVGEIARRAGADDPHDSAEETDNDDEAASKEQTEQQRKRSASRAQREKTAKMMDLQYFLEMVDHKHRYGSNLRAYHEQWKKEDTHENFFYWLDYGEGKNYEHPTVSRQRMDSERVRYLSREERLNYLVTIDGEGRLCWAKNGERINTTPEYKDSVDGVVPVDDDTPAYGPKAKLHSGQSRTIRRSSLISISSSSSASESDAEAEHYVNEDLDKAKGISKIRYVSAATILNHLLRSSVKPNTWIFVADTSFRLYIGIKQSGAFQHSSFLHGARISAAGLIKVKDGQLRRLSPLSGHYRPPTENFRVFVHSLKENGVDMSRVSISRSYALLVGLEAYVKTRRKVKHGVAHMKEAEEKVVHPEEHARKVEEQMDKSQSAQRERQLLAQEAERKEAEKKQESLSRRIWKRLSRGGSEKDDVRVTAKESTGAKQKRKKWLSKPGEDVEDGIAPTGSR
ncbi:hypothetical protein GGP41_005009 [Bipolaris sorokiniana]|uniref:IQ domain-containing protein IQM6 n=1 Tax=Cochliobolus sativus TaxID=45130 RepID=A0A8H6DVJ9_COCSA|nr:hypothetical protein GGP41_005009 [Bipolaris sorokiniana]